MSSCVWKFSAFADTEFPTKKKKEEDCFDTLLDCSHSDHNMDGTYRVTSDDNFGDFDIDNMTLTSNCHVRPMP